MICRINSAFRPLMRSCCFVLICSVMCPRPGALSRVFLRSQWVSLSSFPSSTFQLFPSLQLVCGVCLGRDKAHAKCGSEIVATAHLPRRLLHLMYLEICLYPFPPCRAGFPACFLLCPACVFLGLLPWTGLVCVHTGGHSCLKLSLGV